MNLESIVIPYGVTTIEPEAFGRCKKLQHITLPESIKVVGSGAFTESGLEEMTLTPRIKLMAKDAFKDCLALKRFVVPVGYQADSFGVFRDKVEEMTVPAELEHLCENAPRDQWYYRLKHKNLDELLPRLEEESGVFPVMVTVSGIREDLEVSCFALDSHLFVSPQIGGAYFNAKDAYEGLCGLLDKEIKSIVPDDIKLLAANLTVEYMLEGTPNPSETFDLTYWHWDYAVCFHPLPNLRPGKPIYATVADVWHSASFHPFQVLFGFTKTKTAAKKLIALHPSYEDYPYSQEKPEIIDIL